MTKDNSGPRQEAAAAEPNINTHSVETTADSDQTPRTGVAMERLVASLRATGCRPTGSSARCPAHPDNQPSLSFSSASDVAGVVVKCHAGCTTEQIVAALDLNMADLFDTPKPPGRAPVVVATYPYTDEQGEVLFLKERLEPKNFRLKGPDGSNSINGVRRVLYRLPEVLAAVNAGEPVYVVEGEKDADALVALGLAATCNFDGASTAGKTPKWRPEYGGVLRGADVIVIADKDAAGRAHAAAIVADLSGKSASVVVMEAAVGKDVSDHLAAGKHVEELVPAPSRTATLDEVHEVFRRWLGPTYDLTALDVVLAAAAVEQLDGDPVWLLMISGSGNAKTETVTALSGAGALVTSTITSEGALLSGTSKAEKTTESTGGLLRKLGSRGVFVIKDFTSILSMNRDSRAGVLAALREVYDGCWERNVGSNGGISLRWEGRLVLIGAVTTAYDSAHAVIASMGDRFALVRVDSNLGRLEAGRQALRNVGHEIAMRRELAEAAGDLLSSVRPELADLDDQARIDLLGAANLVTLIRTAVEHDYRGEVLEAHAPEAPTRFAKMLGQLVRGGMALGMCRDEALLIALRVAGDSVPPLRLDILGDLLRRGESRTSEVMKRLQRPRTSVDRALQELHVLGLVVVRDEVVLRAAKSSTTWHYTLHPGVDSEVLLRLVTRNVTTRGNREQEKTSATSQSSADISGEPAQIEFKPSSKGPSGLLEPGSSPAWPPHPAATSSWWDQVPPSHRPGSAPLEPGHAPSSRLRVAPHDHHPDQPEQSPVR